MGVNYIRQYRKITGPQNQNELRIMSAWWVCLQEHLLVLNIKWLKNLFMHTNGKGMNWMTDLFIMKDRGITERYRNNERFWRWNKPLFGTIKNRSLEKMGMEKKKRTENKWKKVELQDHRAGRLEVIQSNRVETRKRESMSPGWKLLDKQNEWKTNAKTGKRDAGISWKRMKKSFKMPQIVGVKWEIWKKRRCLMKWKKWKRMWMEKNANKGMITCCKPLRDCL